MTIDIRTFTRSIYKHLKEGSYVVTKHGKPYLVVTIKPIIDTIEHDVVTNVVTTNKRVHTSSIDNLTQYACGCDKVASKYICPKHKRM